MHHIDSPRRDDAAIEQELQDKGKTAPRVTRKDIADHIASEHYFTAMDGVAGNRGTGIVVGTPVRSPLDLLTFCVLVLKNGFTVTGESACASPENFDAAIGRKLAFEQAVNKMWPLLGFVLKQRLHDEAIAGIKAPPAQPGQYRKKPVVIQAFQMTSERRQDNSNWPEWLNRAWSLPNDQESSVFPANYPDSDGTDELLIYTKEGVHRVTFGDWIIRGVQGELYPCKPDIFDATYAAA